MPHPSVDISIIIPVYNSVDSLPLILERITAVFVNQIRERFELIFVDDCSSNSKTWRILESLAANHQSVRALQLTRNFGRTGAALAGIDAANGNWIIVMDDDLQHRPEDIPKLLTERSHDVVLAQFEHKAHGPIARSGSSVVTWVEHLVLGFPKHLHNSPFVLFKSEIAKHMLHRNTPYPFLPALFLEITRDVVGVKVQHDLRFSGQTEFSFFRRLKHFSNLLINNSSLLLRGVAFIGIVMSFMSFSVGCYLLWRGAGSVPGWTSLMIVTLMIGGLVLVSIGVSGEYLVRIIRGIESQPAYIVRNPIVNPEETGSIPKEEP